MGQSSHSCNTISKSYYYKLKKLSKFDSTFTCFCPSAYKQVVKVSHDLVKKVKEKDSLIKSLKNYVNLLFD